MMGFTFRGVHSSQYNIYMKSKNRSLLPQKRISEEIVLGKHGSYKFEDTYNNRVIEIECSFIEKWNMRRQIAREIAAWLSQEGQLIFDDEPDKYYIARLDNQIDLDISTAMDTFTLTFVCHPFAYSTYINEDVILDSDMVLYTDVPLEYNLKNRFTITGNQTITVSNLGTFETKPKIEITGTATAITLTTGGVAFSIANITQKTYIDCERMICYYIDAFGQKKNKLQDFTGKFLALKPGKNNIAITGAGLNCNIFLDYRNTYL